jgi:hypothetical protein
MVLRTQDPNLMTVQVHQLRAIIQKIEALVVHLAHFLMHEVDAVLATFRGS